jgi:hypothetical protein
MIANKQIVFGLRSWPACEVNPPSKPYQNPAADKLHRQPDFFVSKIFRIFLSNPFHTALICCSMVQVQQGATKFHFN